MLFSRLGLPRGSLVVGWRARSLFVKYSVKSSFSPCTSRCHCPRASSFRSFSSSPSETPTTSTPDSASTSTPTPFSVETFLPIPEKWPSSVPLPARLFQCFRLSAFSDLELRGVFGFLDTDQDGIVHEEDVRVAILICIKHLDYTPEEQKFFIDYAIEHVGKGGVNFETFRVNLRTLAAHIDGYCIFSRVLNLSF